MSVALFTKPAMAVKKIINGSWKKSAKAKIYLDTNDKYSGAESNGNSCWLWKYLDTASAAGRLMK
jgi:hypothetical protein